MTIADVIGIFGVICVLLAYFLLQAKLMESSDLRYSFLNLIGASTILYSLMYTWNTASVIIEFAWIFISLLGIYKNLPFKRLKPAQASSAS